MGIETGVAVVQSPLKGRVASAGNGGWGLKHVVLCFPRGQSPVASAGNGGWGLKHLYGSDDALVDYLVASAGNGGWGLKRRRGGAVVCWGWLHPPETADGD